MMKSENSEICKNCGKKKGEHIDYGSGWLWCPNNKDKIVNTVFEPSKTSPSKEEK